MRIELAHNIINFYTDDEKYLGTLRVNPSGWCWSYHQGKRIDFTTLSEGVSFYESLTTPKFRYESDSNPNFISVYKGDILIGLIHHSKSFTYLYLPGSKPKAFSNVESAKAYLENLQ